MSINLIEESCTVGIIYFEPWAVFFKQKKIFEFLEVVQIFNTCFMFFTIDHLIADEVIFYYIFEAPVVPQ